MTPQIAKQKLNLYRVNEDFNCHSENYLILAEVFNDEIAEKAALLNLTIRDGQHSEEIKSFSRNLAHDLCNHYHYELIKISLDK